MRIIEPSEYTCDYDEESGTPPTEEINIEPECNMTNRELYYRELYIWLQDVAYMFTRRY